MLTEKENLLKVLHGEVPEWVPRYAIPSPGHAPAMARVTPGFMNERRNAQGGFDIWGVEFVVTKETGYMPMPKPGTILLEDITKWRDVIKAPDISNIDWEMMAKKDLEKIDRSQTAVAFGLHNGYFIHLMNFMGFAEGLTAFVDEPDEVMALFEYMNNFYMEVSRKFFEYYKPDYWILSDDIATANSPFISLNTYREFLKPFYEKEASIPNSVGMPIDMHCCGKCEMFIDDWMSFGVNCWQPAQVMNDLVGIKKKYGNKLVLEGCWDSSGPVGWAGAPEELVKQSVREVIDTFAPGGGFVFWASSYGAPDDQDFLNKKRWITEEYDRYGRTFYQKHG